MELHRREWCVAAAAARWWREAVPANAYRADFARHRQGHSTKKSLKDAIDKAIAGEGPAPYALRKFILATGERGLGYRAVFGDRQLYIDEFELYYYIQQQVLRASTEEGMNDMKRDAAIRRAIELEKLEAQGYAPPPTETLDLESMTPEQVAQWMRSQPGYTDW